MPIALALLVALQAATPAGTAVRTPDVIVTGERLKKVHDQCTMGGCTVLRDAQASIAWAESQFRDGRYVEAKRTLAAAARRNARNAATHPKPVAAIYEAHATVSWQEGDQRDYRRAVADRVETLRDNLPADDIAVRGAALALGDMWVRLGDPFEAGRAFADAERAAVAAGQGDVAIRARIARARLRRLLNDRKGAVALLDSADALPGAGEPGPRTALAAMRLRFAALDGDKAEIDRLVAASAGIAKATQPVLVWAPEYPATALQAARAARGRGSSAQLFDARTDATTPMPNGLDPRSTDLDPIRWADIGFWIRPDGRTADFEVLSGSPERSWTAPYAKQVEQRRYTPTASIAEDPGVYRLERFTLRAGYAVPIGSLIRRRAGAPVLEVLDLTDNPARVAARR